MAMYISVPEHTVLIFMFKSQYVGSIQLSITPPKSHIEGLRPSDKQRVFFFRGTFFELGPVSLSSDGESLLPRRWNETWISQVPAI